MDFKLLPKPSTKRITSRPLKDLNINTSDPQESSVPFSFIPKKPVMTPKSIPPSPVTPRCSPSSKHLPNKIKSPSDYVFSTHNHSNKFALTPSKSVKSKTASSTPRSSNSDRQKEHLFNTFKALKIGRHLRQPSTEELLAKEVNLLKPKGFEKKKTVIFDLDETLVHCVSNPEMGQTELEIELPTGNLAKVGINIRPFVKELLSAISKEFEIIVFTASHKCYADKVIDLLDPTHSLIHHRLYRTNCIQIDGVFVKDLRIFQNRAVKDLVIVDNAAYSFAFQILNGIPIISWYNDLEDRELYKLIEYLRVLAKVDDIRSVNQFTFHLDSFYEDYLKAHKKKSEKEN